MSYIILTAIFAYVFGVRNSFQFKEKDALIHGFDSEATKYNKLWHDYQAILHIIFVMTLVCFDRTPDGWAWIPATLACFSTFWIVFDIVVNVKGLDQDWDYVGNTSSIDKYFRSFEDPGTAMIVAKLIFFAIPALSWILMAAFL